MDAGVSCAVEFTSTGYLILGKARGLRWQKELVRLVVFLFFLAGGEDGERSESPSSAGA